MKARLLSAACVLFLSSPTTWGEAAWTNFIRQVQIDDGVEWDVQVADSGEQLTPLAINPDGARIELWTIKKQSTAEYFLDSNLVGTYIPVVSAGIRTEDPYGPIARTRADRPFVVDVTVQGLLVEDLTAPAASKSVDVLRYVQSYGANGTGVDIDRSQATIYSTGVIRTNGARSWVYPLTVVPGTNRAKIRGEENFVFMSLPDYQIAATQLAAATVQIWPVADAAIGGIVEGQRVRFAVPVIALQYNDLYPSSTTYAQVYPGEPRLGMAGRIVPGSAVVINSSVPASRAITVSNWDEAIDGNGQWTMEIVTKTPFGVERLAFVSFDVDRTIQVNGSMTTLE